MASRLPFSFVLTSLLFMFFSSPCSSLKYNDPMVVPTIKQDEKVNLSLYYETLCPACAEFISEYLVDVFNEDLFDILNLKLVPWGNAKTTEPNNTFVCQHGEDECYFNTIHACVIEALPDPKKHFKFIHCLEEQTFEGPIHGKEEMWRSCCQGVKLNTKHIQDCYDSGHGRELELRYCSETKALKPPHQYVPWVTINDNHIEDPENFITYVCNAYKGRHVPEACKSLAQAKTNAAERAISRTSVCYDNEARNRENIDGN